MRTRPPAPSSEPRFSGAPSSFRRTAGGRALVALLAMVGVGAGAGLGGVPAGAAPAASGAGGSGAWTQAAPSVDFGLLEARADTVGTRGRIDREALLADLRTLAHDSMEGRQTGTPGSERARHYLLERFEALGIATLEGERTRSFTFTPRGGSDPLEGVNVLGVVRGTVHPERYLVITAHYDHLGVRNGEIYNGADDNASGTSAILHLAARLQAHPPRHSVIIAALDAEEMGLQGARAFISDPPIPLDRVVMNLNLDMVSRNEAAELYAAGTYHYPFLVPMVEEAAARSRISLLMGHDRPDLPPGDDWTMSSDHGPFHQAGIPFLYFGVEDHPGYHNPTDTYENITPDFYLEAVETILDMLLLVDRHGERILEARSGEG